MGCCYSHHEEHDHEHEEISKKESILTIIGLILFVVAIFITNFQISFLLYLCSYLLIGYSIFINAIKRLFKKDMFDENFIMTIATLGAFVIQDYKEAIAVLIFYKVGEFLQDKAVDHSKNKIKKVLDIRANYANLKDENGIKQVDPSQIKIGDIIVVKTGEKIPLDGIIRRGSTDLDMSSLNGESKPKHVQEKDKILSGSINMGNTIEVEVSSTFENSTVSQIIDLIENATAKKSKTEKFITRFAKIYTPIVTFLAIIILILFPFIFNIPLAEAFTRACTFLVVSCPCALVISVPLGFFAGIGTCSKNGILIKGSNYLDLLNQVDTFVFDKTGTLSKGVFQVTKIETVNTNYTKEQVLEYIAYAEYFSNHYIAKSILEKYIEKIDVSRIRSHEEIAGYGICADIDNKKVICGNDKLMEKYQITYSKLRKYGTIIYLAINEEFVGYLVLSDEAKETSKALIEKLKQFGKYQIYLLTGDNNKMAKKFVEELKIPNYYADLLPQEKAKKLEEIKENASKKVAYIGDGINDSPVLALSDVGISMGKGSDIAIETSDVVLMTDEPIKIIDAIQIAKNTQKIVTENITFAIVVKILFLIFSGLGIVNMWFAVFADVGVALLAILNSIRIFGFKSKIDQ